MAKRFSDSDKWKKPFIRGLQGAYKLLWFYILDDCDHAGIWHVDFEVASIRIGEQVNEKDALKFFDGKIQVFSNGSKWFIKDFIDFQYGELKDNNRLHVSVINILQKNNLGDCKPLARGQGQEQGIIQGQGQDEGQEQGTPLQDEIFMGTIKKNYPNMNYEKLWVSCYNWHIEKPSPPTLLWQWKQKFQTWLDVETNKNPKVTGKANNGIDQRERMKNL
jgi:hypothetical protein